MEQRETTILIKRTVKKDLDELKVHPRESYNDVIERLIHVKKDTGELSEQTLRDIEQSLKEIRGGKIHTLEEEEKRLGIG
jgi:predicted CopG family antitoxin